MRLFQALLCTLVIALPTAAAAGGPSEIDKDAARAAVQQGDERMAAKDYAAALEAYKRADDIMGVPTTSIELGKTHMLLDQMVEAKEAFERAATYPEQENEPAPFTDARRIAKDLAFQLAERIPSCRSA
jgi:tetratricopeptide (TPR) repeat protein